MADKIKFAVALLIIFGAIGAFYYFSDYSTLGRSIGLLVAFALALFVSYQTVLGRQAIGFFRESHVEMRKVVWPTRKETTQTTLIVVATAILVAIMLWIFDIILRGLVSYLTGQGA